MYKSTNLLTIAIPVFERKDFFLDALKSARNQTLECDIIVVDNCSSHDYFETTCESMGVTYYKNERNIGVFPNWNKCFNYSETEYVLILSDDDILDSNYVKYFTQAIKKYSELDIFYSDFSIINFPSLKIINHRHILPFGYFENGSKIIEYGIKYKLGFPMMSCTIRKKSFNGFYDKEHGSNDWLWIYTNVLKLKLFGDERKLVKRGHHSSNDSHDLKTMERTSLSIAYIFSYFETLPLNTELIKIAQQHKKRTLNFFFSIAERKLLNELTSSRLLYANFLNNEIGSLKLSLVKLIPLNTRRILYKAAVRLRLLQNM
jgi:glycosyltransferase involved in cell wall biosynthesis